MVGQQPDRGVRGVALLAGARRGGRSMLRMFFRLCALVAPGIACGLPGVLDCLRVFADAGARDSFGGRAMRRIPTPGVSRI